MRGFALVIVFSLLLLSSASARPLGPGLWSAHGVATWGEDGAMVEGAESLCQGELRAGSTGPMPAGAHKGEHWFWVETVTSQDGCIGLRREGWIHSPHADSVQTLHQENGLATVVGFDTTSSGAREMLLVEWDAQVAERSQVFTLRSVIEDSSFGLSY